MNLPEKEYLTIDELAERWNCESKDIFHYVVTQKLTPSSSVKGAFKLFEVVDSPTDGSRLISLKSRSPEDVSYLDGLFYLNATGKPGLNYYKYNYFSGYRDIGDGSIIFPLINDIEISLDTTSKFFSTNIVFMLEEIKRFERDAIATIEVPIPHSGYPWGSHNTKLLTKLTEAASKFWRLYDPTDPTTAPTNEQVENWLISENISKRMAVSMATILRADDLSRGPRK